MYKLRIVSLPKGWESFFRVSHFSLDENLPGGYQAEEPPASSVSSPLLQFEIRERWNTLKQHERRFLETLAQFRVPVTEEAFRFQGLPKKVCRAWKTLSAKNWIRLSVPLDLEEGQAFRLIAPTDTVAVFLSKLKKKPGQFSHRKAGTYFQHREEEEDSGSFFNLEEAFWHYCQGEAWERVNETGDVLCVCFAQIQSFEDLIHYGSITASKLGESCRSRIWFNLGYAHKSKGNWEEALKWYHKSLEKDRMTGDRKGEAIVLNNMSQVYQAQGNYDAALQHLEESVALLEVTGDRKSQCVTLHNMAVLCHKSGDLERFQSLSLQAYKLSKELGSADVTFGITQYLGGVLCAMGDRERGIQFLKESITIGNAIGHPGTASSQRALDQFLG